MQCSAHAVRMQCACSAHAVRHAARAVHLRQLHAVDDTLREAQRPDGPDGRSHLGRAHVLTFVAEGVA